MTATNCPTCKKKLTPEDVAYTHGKHICKQCTQDYDVRRRARRKPLKNLRKAVTSQRRILRIYASVLAEKERNGEWDD